MRIHPWWVSLAAAVILIPAPAAHAHGLIQSSDPADGAALRRAPGQVRVTLSEAPARGSQISVRDGCGREAATGIELDGADIVVAVGEAEPGPWRVSLKAISSVDGHTSRARFSFDVKGRRDCAREEGPSDDESPPGEDTSSRPPIANDDPPGGAVPWVPIGIGTVALVGLALFLRRGGAA